MANFATAGTADAAGFTDGEIWEVVVQDELLLVRAAGVGIKFLRVVAGAERDERNGLRFAPGEQRRAVRAWQNADFAGNRADLFKITTVEALAAFEDQFANGFLLDVVEGVVDDERGDLLGAVFGDKLFTNFVLDGVAGGFAVELARQQQRGDETVTGEGFRIRENFVGDDLERDFALLLADFRDEFLLRGDDRLNGFLGELQRGAEVGFGNFLGRAFIHDDVFFVADIDEVEIALGLLGVSRVRNELAADATDARRAQRAGPRNVGNHQRGARADDAQNIGIVLAIRAEEHGLDLNFVIPALRKERANRTVGKAAGEDFLFRRTAFAFEVAAGEFTGSGRLFAVVHGEREEVLAFLGLGRGHGGNNNDGFAHLDGHGAVGLLGQFAGFNDDLFVAQLSGDFL